jgi:hypothetical protein
MHLIIAQVTTTTTTSGNMGAASPILTVVWLAVTVALVAAVWKIFAKAGRPGWASLIPIYNTITMLHITGRSGWLILALLVPFWNIYIAIRLVFNLAQVFGRGIGFGFGLLFLSPIFLLILGFGDAQYVGPRNARLAPVSARTLAQAPLAP